MPFQEKVKKARYSNTFNPEWTEKFGCIKQSKLGDLYAYCSICNSDFQIDHGATNDVNKHLKTPKHARNTKAVSGINIASLDRFKTTSFAESVTKAEVIMQGFVLEHNLPIAVNDHFTKVAPVMFPDSKIARSYQCHRTKASHIISAIAADSVKKVHQEVGASGGEPQPQTAAAKEPGAADPDPTTRASKWYSLATDGSNDNEDKYFPVLITHWMNDQVTTSFLDMPVTNEATAKNVYTVITDSLTTNKIGLHKCVAFVSDNASVMVGKHQGVLALIKRQNQAVYGMGCACHLSHLAAKEGGKALQGFDPEDFVLDLFYHFDKR